jgi:hypothetical protein
MALGTLHRRLLDSGLQQSQTAQDDRTQLPSARQPPPGRDRGISQVSSVTDDSKQGLGMQFGKEEAEARRISSPLHYEGNTSPVTSPNGSIQHENLQLPPFKLRSHSEVSTEPGSSIDLSNIPEQLRSNSQISTEPPRSIELSAIPKPLNIPAERTREVEGNTGPQLIMREEVIAQMNNVEEWLQRRQRERRSFYEDLKRVSFVSISTASASPIPDNATSPSVMSTTAFSESPISSSRRGSTMLTTIMENMNKPGPPVPPKDSPWDSPTIPLAQDPIKRKSVEPPPTPEFPDKRSVKPLDTPPSSQERKLMIEDAGVVQLAQTLKVPGYGENVPDGLEVVGQTLISDPGLMLADETQKNIVKNILSPASSVQSVDHALTPDTSFYKYGGFCEGAKMVLRGVGGVMQEKKKPGVGGSINLPRRFSVLTEIGHVY